MNSLRIEIIQIIEYVLCLQKERQTWQKSKTNLLFRVEASKVNEFFKNIRLCDSNPHSKSPFDINNVIIDL